MTRAQRAERRLIVQTAALLLAHGLRANVPHAVALARELVAEVDKLQQST